MIRTQMEMHNRSENGRSAQDTLYDTTSYQWPVTLYLKIELQKNPNVWLDKEGTIGNFC
jgi:hypothetical protein